MPATSNAAPASPSPQPQDAQIASPPSSPSEAPVPTYKKSLSRDELAEKELHDNLAELSSEAQPKEPRYKRTANLPSNNNGPSSSHAQPSDLTLEDSLYPTSMSCREAFDSAFYCQSLGGQFNALYRYGGIKSCSEHWSAFWFCMRTKSYAPEQRAAMVRDHYKKRDLKYKVGPSSEDVWEGRERKVEWGEAFSQAVEELLPGESDEEWNRRERERREGRAAGTI